MFHVVRAAVTSSHLSVPDIVICDWRCVWEGLLLLLPPLSSPYHSHSYHSRSYHSCSYHSHEHYAHPCLSHKYLFIQFHPAQYVRHHSRTCRSHSHRSLNSCPSFQTLISSHAQTTHSKHSTHFLHPSTTHTDTYHLTNSHSLQPIRFSRALLLSCLNSLGFRWYPGVSSLLVVTPLTNHRVSLPSVSIPCVFVSIWGYPLSLGLQEVLPKSGGCARFS